jgi:hypothetical protein
MYEIALSWICYQKAIGGGTCVQIQDRIKFAITGGLAGLANGFFGAGGGLFLVPLFIGWLGLTEQKAFATSVAVILPFCAVSAWIYWHNGNLDLMQALPYLIGGALGGFLSGRIFKKMNMAWLRRIFGLLILYGGIRSLFLL